MNLDKVSAWSAAVVLTFAATGQLEVLQSWIWKAQARVLYESRASTWGSPRFFAKTAPSFKRSVLRSQLERKNVGKLSGVGGS